MSASLSNTNKGLYQQLKHHSLRTFHSFAPLRLANILPAASDTKWDAHASIEAAEWISMQHAIIRQSMVRNCHCQPSSTCCRFVDVQLYQLEEIILAGLILAQDSQAEFLVSLRQIFTKKSHFQFTLFSSLWHAHAKFSCPLDEGLGVKSSCAIKCKVSRAVVSMSLHLYLVQSTSFLAFSLYFVQFWFRKQC